MNRLFCDTLYFAALINPRDQWHQASIEIESLVQSLDLVTTEEVLIELLNFYCEFGPVKRAKVSAFVRTTLVNPKFEIIGRREMAFLTALELYESRLDKGYSLTDCISMNACRELGIAESSRTISILSRKDSRSCCRFVSILIYSSGSSQPISRTRMKSFLNCAS